MADLVLSLMMLACLFLAVGAVFLWRRGQRKQAGLMAVLVLVIGANIAIWTVPTENSRPLAESAPE